MEGECITFTIVTYNIVSLPEAVEAIATMKAQLKPKDEDLAKIMAKLDESE